MSTHACAAGAPLHACAASPKHAAGPPFQRPPPSSLSVIPAPPARPCPRPCTVLHCRRTGTARAAPTRRAPWWAAAWPSSWRRCTRCCQRSRSTGSRYEGVGAAPVLRGSVLHTVQHALLPEVTQQYLNVQRVHLPRRRIIRTVPCGPVARWLRHSSVQCKVQLTRRPLVWQRQAYGICSSQQHIGGSAANATHSFALRPAG